MQLNQLAYHLTADGPKECHATIGPCPYRETPHFSNLLEAEQAYSDQFSQKPHKKTFAPEKSTHLTPTRPEAESLLLSLREANPNVDLLRGNLVSFSPFGSVLYNLDHPKSDNDLFLITDKKAKGDFQTLDETKRDVRVSSVYTFVDEYKRGIHFNVDVFHTTLFQKASNTPWRAFMNNARFQDYQYLTRLRDLSKVFTDGASKRNDTSHRALKFLKTALRNEILANRFQREERVRPVFSEKEREAFYRTFAHVSNEFIDHPDAQALIASAAKEVS